jgi:hypothetical protein
MIFKDAFSVFAMHAFPNSYLRKEKFNQTNMQQITNEQMQEMLMQTKEYTLVLLRFIPGVENENMQQILWEHGRKNFQLRAEGLINVVAPVSQPSEVAGIAIFNADAAKVREIMNEDPAVKEGIFTFDVLPVRSFPGDSLSA